MFSIIRWSSQIFTLDQTFNTFFDHDRTRQESRFQLFRHLFITKKIKLIILWSSGNTFETKVLEIKSDSYLGDELCMWTLFTSFHDTNDGSFDFVFAIFVHFRTCFFAFRFGFSFGSDRLNFNSIMFRCECIVDHENVIGFCICVESGE